MNKDYSIWHNLKSYLNNHKPRLNFNEREVWLCSLGINIGFEQDGKGDRYLRPVVVIKKFNNKLFWAIPLTRTPREGKYYYKFSFDLKTDSIAILSQLRLIDSKRLKNRIGRIKPIDLLAIKQKLKQLLE